MRQYLWILFVCLLIACDSEDNLGPEACLNNVFEAAVTEDFSRLSSLCDPMRENDPDTQRICDVTDETAESFIEYFKTGKVVGTPTFAEGKAVIRFEFGPESQLREASMELIQREGKWYLFNF